MPEVLDEVLRLDNAGQYQDIITSLLRQSNDAHVFLSATTHLLKHSRFQGASHLGSALVRAGVEHPVTHLSCAIDAMLRNDHAAEVASTAALGQQIDLMTPAQQSSFYAETLHPTLYPIASAILEIDDNSAMLRLLEILKAGAPRFREIFDWSVDAAAAQTESRRASLITYRSPPADAPKIVRRTVVAMREKTFWRNPASRLLEVPPCLVEALGRYGWSVQFTQLLLWDLVADFKNIVDVCQKVAADVLILDDFFIHEETTHALRRNLISILRQLLPNIKIVAFYFDSWEIAPAFLQRMAPDVDALWALNPSLPLWSEAVFADKVLQAPFPLAGNLGSPPETAPSRIRFTGGFMGYNWHRMFWRAASIKSGLPIDWNLSTHITDGLPALESFAAYMRRLADCGCSLNLAMRHNMTCTVTGRTFETLSAGALLIQEDTADLDYFMVAGEHYLRFRTFAELRAITDMLLHQPEKLQRIRLAGHEFAVARYSDEKLIGYLDALLFHS